ncbi:flagellar hook-basal body complex protein FliE [Endothiovibrio diazotrophicus]
MNDFDVNSVLSQMRAMRAEAQGVQASGAAGIGAVQEGAQAGGSDFATLLRNSIDSVNEAQQTSKSLQESFVRGDSDVGLEQVMIATQKASLSFAAMKSVHGKLLEAYNEIKRMQV